MLCRDWNPSQVEQINYMMTRLYPWHKLLYPAQFQELASRKWEPTNPGTEDWLLKTINTMLIKPPHDEFQDDWQSWLFCSSCSSLHLPTPLKFPFKSPCPLVNSWELVLGDESTFSPSCQAPDKASFLFNQHLPLKKLAFKQRATGSELIP